MKNLDQVAKTSARFIVIFYALIQAFVYIFFALDNAHERVITNAVMILIVLVLTSFKGFSRLHLSIIVPLTISALELFVVSFFTEGSRIIYMFLIGASLVSFIFVNVNGLLITTSLITASVVFLLFVCDIRLLGPSYSFNDELFNFFSMTFCFIVLLMIGRYSVGIFGRSQKTGDTFAKVLKNSSGLIIIVNNEARVEYISKSFTKILDIEKQEYAINLPLVDLFPYIELKYFFGELLEHEGIIETTFDIKTSVKNPSSAVKSTIIRSFMLHSVPMSENGIARFFDCVEITPIIESQRVAEAATRSKSEFLATTSHEIRTPLNTIMGIVQIQLEDKSLPVKYAAAQEKIFSSSKNLLGIINDILDMSKIETGKLQLNIMEYNVPGFINDTVQQNIVRIGSKPIEFKLDVNENVPLKLLGDELRLKQVLSNILSNAIKYTEKGYVKMSVRHEIIDKDINMIFAVEDTGQGMKSEDKDRLFTKYLRFNTEVNRNTEGTGLGLNISQKIVNKMDGRIDVESEWGKGSTFTVTVRQEICSHESALEYVPIGTELTRRLCDFTLAGESHTEEMQITRELMPYGKVLIVDDIYSNLYVAKEMLTPYGLNIDTVNSGFAAIEKIENGQNYDIIFMDHMMPKMNGIETTKKLRAFGYKGYIVALTANALAGNDKMFEQNGFDGFITKPIDINILNSALNKFIRDQHPEEAKKYKPETKSP